MSSLVFDKKPSFWMEWRILYINVSFRTPRVGVKNPLMRWKVIHLWILTPHFIRLRMTIHLWISRLMPRNDKTHKILRRSFHRLAVLQNDKLYKKITKQSDQFMPVLKSLEWVKFTTLYCVLELLYIFKLLDFLAYNGFIFGDESQIHVLEEF